MKFKGFPLIGFDFIYQATNHFSHESKLGEGGFGSVYKVIMLVIVNMYFGEGELEYSV